MSIPATEPIAPIPARPKSLWHPLPFALLLAVLSSFAIDLPIAAYAKNPPPRWISELLEIAETFGNGYGVAAIIIGVVILDPSRRRSWPQLLAATLGAGLTSNLIKLLFIRTRPRDIELLPETVWATFGGLWSLSKGNSAQSFPSSHTATAVGLAVILSEFYPRGRWYFAVLAILVGVQRIQVSAHYASDVFAGAIVGWCIGTLCVILDPQRKNSASPQQ